MTLIFSVVKQIEKQLFNELINCKADFRFTHSKNQFDIKNVKRYNFDIARASEEQIAITFEILGNPTDNMILIQRNNITSFELT